MTLQWLLYCAALGTLLALAAAALEGGARALRLPTRWGWAAALALTVALPFVAWLRPPTPSAPDWTSVESAAAVVPRVAMLPLAETGQAAATALPWLAAAERALAAGWGLASAAVLVWIVAMGALLAYRRRRWTADAAAGVPVFFAPDTGPAVVGLLRGRIVLPAWAREAEPRVLETMVAHEREHLRAGDHRLLGLGLFVAAAMPWHPAAWWMLRRLRLAVEVDCDARVIRGRADVHAYGCVLLEVGQRAGRLPLGAAALTQPVSFLERRIRIMTSPRVRFPRLRAGVLAAVASGLVLAACEMATPSGPSQVETRRVHGDADAPGGIQPAQTGPREAVLQYFPGLAHESGDAGANLIFVIAADGSIVQADRVGDASTSAAAGLGMGSRNETLSRLGVGPDDIHTIEMIRFPAGTAAPVRVGVIWMRLKPATAGAAESGGRENIWPARIGPVVVEGAEEAMVLQPLTPAEAGATRGESEAIIVLPTRADGTPSADSEARILQNLRPTRMFDGVGADVLVVITDAAGNEVHRGAMPSASDLTPDMIATINIRKGPAAANPSGEIHIRLKD